MATTESVRILPGEVSGQPRETSEVAKLVLGFSSGAILVVSAVAIIAAALVGTKGEGQRLLETCQMVFNALLPLLGTWVGTVLAYYFSRKNFESASDSVERLVSMTTEQKLKQLSVAQEMLHLPQITSRQVAAGQSAESILLKELFAGFGGKITRMPILDSTGAVLFIVHQSGLFKFLAKKALEGMTKDQIDKLTMKELIDDAELKSWISNIAFVSEAATVAEAKSLMEHRQGCQDLIVTRTGDKAEPLQGWMTNVDIGRLSRA